MQSQHLIASVLFILIIPCFFITLLCPAYSKSSDSYSLIQGSDDYQTHKDIFAKTASKLIDSGRCTAADFIELGGWLKSTNYKNKPIYFTYCGGFTLKNKIYLNVKTGKLF